MLRKQSKTNSETKLNELQNETKLVTYKIYPKQNKFSHSAHVYARLRTAQTF